MRWLETISNAWDDFQASRTRDAVYGYLDAVFAIVEHYKMRRRTKDFCGMRLNLLVCPLTKMLMHLLPSFAARAPIAPIVRRSANGRGHCGT